MKPAVFTQRLLGLVKKYVIYLELTLVCWFSR